MKKLKTAAISDTHSLHTKLIIEPCDVLIHSGDVSNIGEKQDVENFLFWFAKQPAKYKIFIAGNHDFFFDYDWKAYTPQGQKRMSRYAKKYTENDIDNLLSKYPNIIYLNNSSIIIEGIKFYGTPYSPCFYDWAFNRERGAGIQSEWDKIESDTNVLVVHGPPYHKGDELERLSPGENDYHIGDKNLKDTIENKLKQLTHCIFGHIHDNNRVKNYGLTEENGVSYINASILNDDYKVVNKPFYFEVEIEENRNSLKN